MVGPGKPFYLYCGVPLGALQDAGTWARPRISRNHGQTRPSISPPAYWRELQRRNTLQGKPVNLNDYRKEQPARYPLDKPRHRAECRQGAASG
jgi:hypothetical protein